MKNPIRYGITFRSKEAGQERRDLFAGSSTASAVKANREKSRPVNVFFLVFPSGNPTNSMEVFQILPAKCIPFLAGWAECNVPGFEDQTKPTRHAGLAAAVVKRISNSDRATFLGHIRTGE
jgi:hypothetical protein